MKKAWLALGANLGNRHQQITDALMGLNTHPDITLVAQSSLMETKAWGKTDQPDFLNMAAEIDTNLSPEALLETCLMVEQSLGRERGEKWGPRVIDIDIIAFEGVAMKTSSLTLPHPHAGERTFVLRPLAEIAPDLARELSARQLD